MSEDKIKIEVDEDLEDLIPGFLKNRNVDVEKLKQAHEANDYETIRSIAHSLKGVGGGYGFMRMSELGAEIETAAKNKQLDSVKSGVDELESYLTRVDITFV
ncbi:MAG: Hpt domain-containing protein [Pseudomonadota bacterium]